jgi:hypothetical protein
MKRLRTRVASLVGVALGVGSLGLLVGAGSSCQQTPQNVPLRTFERAQRLDVVCMRVLDDTGRPIEPVPTVQTQCAPVPADTDGSLLPYHLFALVTQSLRGEIAIVDLTAAKVVDTDLATPGVNFLPVGNFPTDVAVSPDGVLSFVTSAEVNKPALYAVANSRILGDSQRRGGVTPDISLSAWPVCLLPETPVAVTTVPRELSAPDGGAPIRTYEVVVVLAGSRNEPAKVVTMDPAAFRRGVDPTFAIASPGPTVAPGSLSACPVTSAVALAAAPELPKVAAPGPRWPDGVTYVAGGAPPPPMPFPPLSCVPTAIPQATPGAATSLDGGTNDAGPSTVAPPPAYPTSDGGPTPLPLGDDAPRASAVATDGTLLYVADDLLPVIHRVDLRKSPARELPPLLLTDSRDATRRVRVKAIAASPTTRDFRRYLYAIDRTEGSLLVYDVSDPDRSPLVPLRRPHPEINPLQPEDRVVFGAPAAAVAFTKFDWPYKTTAAEPVAAVSGVLCEPSPETPVRTGPGRPYATDAATKIGAGVAGTRLRGVFGFVTLSNGATVTLDVDDWDAPCRRPRALDGNTSDVSPAAPDDPADPYKISDAALGVTEEVFYPVSAPHRPRSKELLKDDSRGGNRVPRLEGTPQLVNDNAVLPTIGRGAEANPIILATNDAVGVRPASAAAGSSPANVRMSFETPEVHAAQDWQVVYEGALPTVEKDGIVGLLDSTDGNRTMVVKQPQAGFCGRGVQDFAMGAGRAAQAMAELKIRKWPDAEGMDVRTADYVQITDELLPGDSGYWAERWPELPQLDTAQRRFEACSRAFGPAGDASLERDFPILEAYDDRLVLSRFFYPKSPRAVGTRLIAAADDTNRDLLAFARRCFHDQIRFRIRAGGQWLATGTASGYLRNVVRSETGRCAASCDGGKALLNARAMPVPRPASDAGALVGLAPSRNSALAMRNPMFSFVIFNGVGTAPTRDLTFKFGTRGEFVFQSIATGAGSTAVSPQSMRFIESLGQLAVVDGSAQGLILIDLANVTFARPPFF